MCILFIICFSKIAEVYIQQPLFQKGRQQSFIDDGEQEAHDLRQFLKGVRKYTDPEELTAETLNELVDKIIVHAPDKSSGHRRQKIEICYEAAGIIDSADDLCKAGDGRGQWYTKHKKTA